MVDSLLHKGWKSIILWEFKGDKILLSEMVVKGAPRSMAHQSLYDGASPGKEHALLRKNTLSYHFLYSSSPIRKNKIKSLQSSFISHLFIFLFPFLFNLTYQVKHELNLQYFMKLCMVLARALVCSFFLSFKGLGDPCTFENCIFHAFCWFTIVFSGEILIG